MKATTHGKKFFVTGGEHINSNDMFISAEMGNGEREIAEMEKGKKVRIEFHVRRNATLVVLDGLDHELDGNIDRLTNKDLEVLLRWKGVLPSKMGNMANQRALYQQFAGDRGDDDLGDPPRWTEADEANLEERRNTPVEMGDTACRASLSKDDPRGKRVFQTEDGRDRRSRRRRRAIPPI